jgi:hypothetical protein
MHENGHPTSRDVRRAEIISLLWYIGLVAGASLLVWGAYRLTRAAWQWLAG